MEITLNINHGHGKAVCVCVTIFSLFFSTASAKGSERQDFLSEIETMKKVTECHNPHVVSMIGCVTTQEPLCLLTEFVQYGDLLSYLRTNNRLVISNFSIVKQPGNHFTKFKQ